jgi:hypothetical protein
MSNPVPDSRFPVVVALGLASIGLLLGLVLSGGGGKLAAGLIAGCGAIPAAVGMWKGIQQSTQTTLALSLVALLVSLGVAAVMIIWAIVQFVR